MQNAVIVDAVRTPLGKRNGKLKDVHPVELAAHTLRALVERNDFVSGASAALSITSRLSCSIVSRSHPKASCTAA